MPEKISWSFTVQAEGGPTVTAANDLTLETYAKSSATVANAATVNIEVPASPTLLVVSASKYHDDQNNFVKYKINGQGNDKNLDGPLVFIGADNVKMIDPNLTSLSFSNPLTDTVTIEVFACKDI